MHPITERHPLGTMCHWIAATKVEMDLGIGITPMQQFYNPLGLTLLGTVTDNDCGLDVMCMMLQIPQTAMVRGQLRAELSDYLLYRIETSWMQDLMAATCEIRQEDVLLARKCGLTRPAEDPIVIIEGDDHGEAIVVDPVEGVKTVAGEGHAGEAAAMANAQPAVAGAAKDPETRDHPEPAAEAPMADWFKSWHEDLYGEDQGASPEAPVAEGQSAVAESAKDPAATPTSLIVALAPPRETVLKALAWATGTKDHGILAALEESMPEWCVKEQVAKYAEAQAIVPVQKPPQRIVVRANGQASHLQVAEAFGQHLAQHQVALPKAREGYGRTSLGHKRATSLKVSKAVWKSFMDTLSWPKALENKHAYQRKQVKRWYFKSLLGDTVKGARGRGNKVKQGFLKRKRAAGDYGTHLVKAPILRKRLYEWFLSVRYAIDWKEINARARSGGRPKAIGRFPRSLLKAKLKQFQAEYAEECLTRGVKVSLFEPNAKWFKSWENEYGLSMQNPNRKYKCSKALLAKRLEAFWITVFRIRALCMALHGYDPDIENFDQTPYHANESGSQDARTLAVAGEGKVPLIEGHAETRVRWTANLTTFSDAERIRRGELPYCEFMFKHNIKGEQSSLELRLREHIRGRGYGPWVSVATSPSGSYTQDDVLNFLDRHLPRDGPQWRARYWRIMFADDFAAHKVSSVRRLCWQRGYVLVLQPGGATPFTQTCDTDLNQHVRRGYIALETQEFIRHFQRGETIPKLTPETMIDLMVEVLSDPKIHLNAAAGYKKTAVAVALDHSGEDLEIMREAADFWRELDMRVKVNAEVAAVRAEAEAGRLAWTYSDVLNLMVPYPKSKEEDALIALSHDQGDCEIAEQLWLDACEGDAGREDDAESDSSSEADVANEVGHEAPKMNDGEACSDVALAGQPQWRTGDQPQLSADVAVAFEESHGNMACLENVRKELLENGLLKQAHTINIEITKERRRLRGLAREDKGVALALEDRARRAEEREREAARRAQDAHREELTAKRLKAEISAAARELKEKKAAVAALEDILETKHAVKTFTPEFLGQGLKKAGGAKGRDARFDVLDRLAHLGAGLSPEQRNDWPWFKAAWDAKMVSEHDKEWPVLFAGWVQQVLEDMTHEAGSNAFSCFVHQETLRCLSGEIAIRIPAA